MKFFYALNLLLFIQSNAIIAQKMDSMYFDKNFNVTKSKNFEYYRLYASINGVVKVTDYYKNGKVQMTGGFKSIDFKERIGPFYFYDRKGHVEEIQIYEPSKYPQIVSEINNSGIKLAPVADSLIFLASFYKNGNIQDLGYGMNFCNVTGTWLFFESNGKLEEIINYRDNIRDGDYFHYFLNRIKIIGHYHDGKEDGAWEYYNYHGQLYLTNYYSNGEKIKAIRYDTIDERYKPKD
jgi:antitoxin component YwqK of YwqJK toxin-antitoxin module